MIVKTSIRIPEQIDAVLEKISKDEMISKNALIVRACRELIECLNKHKEAE